MSIQIFPESVRQSELAVALDEKLRASQTVSFDYWGEFRRLRDTVSAQVGEMKILFPQFTPHDEGHHLARLFGIADKLLGPRRYEKMNAAELFLLACGLYAHDWGMAVGNEELDFMRSGATGNVTSDVFTPLDDETERLRQFVETQGIRATEPAIFPTLSDEELRLYIRWTHAWRSGVRARSFFKAAGASVPQSLEKVCQGHWLGFPELDDEQRFSSHAGVLGHTVDLRAIALYVRLIDLFDISDDRTPYAIWRFVAPLDGVSQMEWRKHRALSPVTFPKYGDGRCVRFDGSTSDPEVWAELEDLRHYCEEQLAGTMDLIARHRNERHQLDLRKLEWAVSAERFKPVNIRFEFHRRRMFEILADEIYQGDSHVFLRELLQNSIDAIRMRRELVQRRTRSAGRRHDVGLGFDDAIYFDVKHAENGDATVCCRDYGIGMNEYIVRNYLSVAGVSYYQSDEFRHLGLKIDPISRFGIGILSCFMVAWRIEIETRREPQTAEDPEPLLIDVPAVDRQFRIYPASNDVDVGTAVTVHVVGNKLKGDVRKAPPGDDATIDVTLQVAEYLCEVAGFVEFPVVVDENGKRTVIFHPDRPSSDADGFRIEGVSHEVRQLSNEYRWEKAFAPQDAEVAQMHLRQQSFDLQRDLGLKEYEGTVSYIKPVSDEAELGYTHTSGVDTAITISTGDSNSVTLRFERTLGYHWMKKEGLAPSSQTNHALSIYRDGLLVADAKVPTRDSRFLGTSLFRWPIPALRVNLPKRLGGNVDVTRRALTGTDPSWDAPIWQGVVDYLKTHDIAEALDREPPSRVERLGQLAHMFHLTETEIAELVPNIRWPLPMLVPNEGAVILDNQFVFGQITRIAPESLNDRITNALGWGYHSDTAVDSSFLSLWRGNASIASPSLLSGAPFPEFWSNASERHLQRVLAPVGVCFLRPPYPGLPCLPQNEFQCITPSEISELDLIEQTMCDPLSLDLSGFCALRSTWWHYDMRHILAAAPFNPPFESFFIGNDSVPNRRHPITVALLRCLAAVRWHQLKESRRPADIGKAVDQLNLVAKNLHRPGVQAMLDGLWALVKQGDFLEFEEPPPLSADDFIPVSESSKYMQRALSPRDNKERQELAQLTERHLRPFGDAIEEVEPENAPPDVIEAMSDRL